VTQAQIDQMMVVNPRRFLTAAVSAESPSTVIRSW
jgi:hypothetical protein